MNTKKQETQSKPITVQDIKKWTREISKSEKKVQEVLTQTGVYTRQGKLTEQFR